MKKIIVTSLLAFCALNSYAQKRSLEWSDVTSWNRITAKQLSDDGKYVAVETAPWIGDGITTLYGTNGSELKSFDRAQIIDFTSEGLLMLKIQPAKALVDSLTLKKVKKEKMPMAVLCAYNPADGTVISVDSLVDYKTSDKNGSWLAYRTGSKKQLHVTNFDGEQFAFDDVDKYQFSKEEGRLIFNRFVKDSISSVGVINLNKAKVAYQINLEKTDKLKTIAVNSKGEGAITVVGENKDGSQNHLYLTSADGLTEIKPLGNNAIINENLSPYFSENEEVLYFGSSQPYEVADSTILDRDKAKVDVWVWDEPKLQSQQVVDRDKDAKRAFIAQYIIDDAKVMNISGEEYPLATISEGGEYALLRNLEPYQMESMWKGVPRYDVALMNLSNGNTVAIDKGIRGEFNLTPNGNYLYWYQPCDSSWYSYSVASGKQLKLTSPQSLVAYNELNSTPSLPRSYGVAFVSEDDQKAYVYDRYDIWELSLDASASPQRITNGRENKITYRVIDLDTQKSEYSNGDELFLSQFNDDTKESGYSSMKLGASNMPKSLVMGKYRYLAPTKSKDSDVLMFTRENFEEFPDVYISDIDFAVDATQITHLVKQQEPFVWGSVEPISWVSLAGDTLRGNLYKPQNYEEGKKYPMICNFYETDSDNLYSYRMPQTHRSTIDYHYYTSNGYIIFNPDVKYYDGYPGESCYNSIMPGITKIVESGCVDIERIGAQGHSWGGYQVAYLATRTNLFAAIESGAPVVNMFSAYGGIRWQTGLNRSFQYEMGQSRIGGSIWEYPLRYSENSPIFTMDKVTTPILIMHNDMDGHVPWYQGIEYFISLRRLGKPAWMLNYNNEPHWPLKQANQLDFQTKMAQFFDYYLKGEQEMPKWMRGDK